jgi:hypothetical protein
MTNGCAFTNGGAATGTTPDIGATGSMTQNAFAARALGYPYQGTNDVWQIDNNKNLTMVTNGIL